MIEALSGPQPINFNQPPFMGCACEIDGNARTLVLRDDMIVFQLRKTPCDDDTLLFSALTSLVPDEPGWTYTTYGDLRVVPGLGTVNGVASFSVVVGMSYRIDVVGANLHDAGFSLSMGGHVFDVDASGDHTFVFTATTSGSLTLTSTNESGFLLGGLNVYDFGFGVQIIVTDKDGDHAPLTYADHTSWFTFAADTVTVTMPVSAALVPVGECFTITVEDTCDGGSSVTSQSLRVVVPDCSLITFRGCLDGEAMGFQPFAPRLTVPATVGRASWKTEGEEEHASDGTRRITSANRELILSVRTGAIGYDDHNFLSSLPLWDHVYVYQGSHILEVQAAMDGYEPSYDVSDTVGTVEFNVKLRQELVNKVACGALGDGCSPAEDPICPHADITTAFNVGGDALNITLNSILEFMPGTVTVTINGGTPIDFTFDTGSLPDTIVVHEAHPTDYIVVHIANAVQTECYDEITLGTPPLICVGEGIASVKMQAVPSGGTGAYISANTSTGHFAIRDSVTGVVSVDGTPAAGRGYCVFSCDEAGHKSGSITEITIANASGFDVSGLASTLTMLTVLEGSPATVDLSGLGILDTLVIYECPLITGITGPSPSALRVIGVISSNNLANLPDMDPSSVGGSLLLGQCAAVTSVGVLSKLSYLTVSTTGITSSTDVDALVNALDPSVAGTAVFNGLLSSRTSASDANYEACISAGWAIS